MSLLKPLKLYYRGPVRLHTLLHLTTKARSKLRLSIESEPVESFNHHRGAGASIPARQCRRCEKPTVLGNQSKWPSTCFRRPQHRNHDLGGKPLAINTFACALEVTFLRSRGPTLITSSIPMIETTKYLIAPLPRGPTHAIGRTSK